MRSFVALSSVLALFGAGAAHAQAGAPVQVGASKQEIPSVPTMLGIDGNVVFFYYDSLEAAEEFYSHTLGFRKSFDAGWVKLYQISDRSYVGLVNSSGTHGAHKNSEGRAVMLSIVTRNLEDWWRTVQSRGAHVLKPYQGYRPDKPTNGFLLQDPGGYTVEFFSWGKNAAGKDG